MLEYVPEIQERLRRSLPRFSAGEDLRVQVAQAASVQRTPRWEFQSKGQTQSVVLTQDFLAVQTTDYDVYERFEEFFTKPLEILGEVVEPSLVQRIGLRYVDLIRATPERSLEEFLKPGLRGISADDIGASDALSRFETLAKTDAGVMRVRCLESNDGSPLPPDLGGTTLSLASTPAADLQPGEKVAFLDFDHFSSDPIDYQPATIAGAIGRLHDSLDQAFRAAVTDDAMDSWGKVKR